MVRAARTSNRIVAGFIDNAFPGYVVFAGDSLQDAPKPGASSDFSVAAAPVCLSSGGHPEYLEAIVGEKRGASPLLPQQGGPVVFNEGHFGNQTELSDQIGDGLRPYFLPLTVQKDAHG